jgi:tol-pal system protein YbgF
MGSDLVFCTKRGQGPLFSWQARYKALKALRVVKVLSWCVLSGNLGIGLAHAGLFDDDEARRAILELRNRFDTQRQVLDGLSQQVDKLVPQIETHNQEATYLKKGLLDMTNQLEVLRTDLARQNGQLEELNKALNDIRRIQSERWEQIDGRLRRAEPVSVTVDGLEFQATTVETKDFQDALALFRKGDFIKARRGFEDFLIKYPASGYRFSTLFWLSSSLYTLPDCKKALDVLTTFLGGAPSQHLRFPDALLTTANCQKEMGELASAQGTFRQLIERYPQSDAAAFAKKTLADGGLTSSLVGSSSSSPTPPGSTSSGVGVHKKKTGKGH